MIISFTISALFCRILFPNLSEAHFASVVIVMLYMTYFLNAVLPCATVRQGVRSLLHTLACPPGKQYILTVLLVQLVTLTSSHM